MDTADSSNNSNSLNKANTIAPPSTTPIPPISCSNNIIEQTVSTVPSELNKNVPTAPVTQVKWTKVKPVEKPRTFKPMPRHGHRCVAIGNLLIIFAGGNEGLYKELFTFDIVTKEWDKPQVKGGPPDGRAAYGMAAFEKQNKVLICGGMLEYLKYSMDIWELNVTNWEWKELHPVGPLNTYYPLHRMGHSFTPVRDQVYLFGGLATRNTNVQFNEPLYLNDLLILHPGTNLPNGAWEHPQTYGAPPCPRESHSAVAYSSKDGRFNKLIIFGGMNGTRLGDTYTFDVDTAIWCKMGESPYSPLPRSLHSACVIGERMYIFGGWVVKDQKLLELRQSNPHQAKYSKEDLEKLWKCTNTLGCLNVETMTWETVQYVPESPGVTPILPKPRAGHSVAVVNNRMYLWSGRDEFNKIIFDAKDSGHLQTCHEDMFYLDVEKPAAPVNIQQLTTSAEVEVNNSLRLTWDPVPGAESYIVQIQEYDPAVDGPKKVVTVTAPATYSQQTPIATEKVRLPIPVGSLIQPYHHQFTQTPVSSSSSSLPASMQQFQRVRFITTAIPAQTPPPSSVAQRFPFTTMGPQRFPIILGPRRFPAPGTGTGIGTPQRLAKNVGGVVQRFSTGVVGTQATSSQTQLQRFPVANITNAGVVGYGIPIPQRLAFPRGMGIPQRFVYGLPPNIHGQQQQGFVSAQDPEKKFVYLVYPATAKSNCNSNP